MKKIAFMGSDPISIPLLEYLEHLGGDSFKLMGVISQPDRPSGRGQQRSPNPISAWAIEHEIPLLRPEKPAENELSWLRGESIDLIIVMAYGHIIKKEFLEFPPCGIVNLHASVLPKYRGASPIETAIACGEEVTGVSLMEVVPKMDAGGVKDVELVKIKPQDTGAIIREKMAQACVPLIARNLKKLLSGEAVFVPQDEAEVSYCRKITKEDGWINFKNSAKEIVDRIRAFKAWPGGYFQHKDIFIKIGECAAQANAGNFKPGTIVATGAEGLIVATSDGLLNIKSLQRPGGKMLPVDDFLRGYELEVSEVLVGHQGEALVSPEPFLKKKSIA